MSSAKDSFRIDLTTEQKDSIRKATGKDAEAVELSVEELEARIAPSTIIDVFGSDAFRYYFMKAIPFGQDGSFSWEDMAARYKAELADQLGNLASRLTSMVIRYRDGALPAPVGEPALAAALATAVDSAEAAIDRLDLQGKHLVLGLSGGIACYKSAELVRELVKAGATVQVVMTEADRKSVV